MAIPTARVKVEILKITGLPAVALPAGRTRYAVGVFQGSVASPPVRTGRSRPIPDAGGDFDLTVEATPWVFEADKNLGEIIAVSVETREDHGDAAPPAPAVLMTEVIADPWKPETKIVGAAPGVQIRITTTLVNAVDAAFLGRATAAGIPSGALAIPEGVYVEITDVKGLYKPDPAAVIPAKGSKPVAGYISEDNLGRIFTNRIPDGTWRRDTQFIDVEVKITAFGARTIPAAAKVEWTIEDADDATNDDPNFHRDWGPYIDRNDYDAAKKPTGAKSKDNTAAFKPGNADENKLFGATARASATARWAKTTAGPTPAPTSRTKATTAIALVSPKNGKSSIRVHCMNTLGTNLIVKATVRGMPAGVPVFGTKTGVMTMWSRIDVEVARMAGAHSLSGALALIPKFFLPACVQLDFQAQRNVTGALDKANIATSDDSAVFDPATEAWVNNPGVFTHKSDPGWFFLGAARFPYPLPPAGPVAPLLSGVAYTISEESLEVTGAAAAAEFVDFTWTDGAGVTHNAGFSVNRSTVPTVAAGKTKMKLFGNDVTPEFTGHDADGSISHAHKSTIMFYPRNKWPGGSAVSLVPGGYGVPVAGATVEVFGPGQVFTSGVSPTVKNPHAATAAALDEDYFAGRTIIFTHTASFSDGIPPVPKADFNTKVLRTVVHEFLHAFGMPHKCGHWNWRTPRDKSCCMNYFNTWLLDSSKNLVPGTVGKQGDEMCGRHLMEVRRVHLEKNLGLRW
jgi:hypothetical protein